MTDIGLIGAGYWGSKWARVLDQNDVFSWVCDADPVTRLKTQAQYDVDDPEQPDWDNCDGVIIATPADTHADLTREALENDVHVLVEKPITRSVMEAEELSKLADEKGLVYMAGHTYLYSRPVFHLFHCVQQFDDITYIRFDWLNDGIVRDDVDVLWNVAPHPLSILFFIHGGEEPDRGLCIGSSLLTENDQADVVNASLIYPSGLLADINVSWADPDKVRQITVVGDKGKVKCYPNRGELEYTNLEGKRDRIIESGDEPLQIELEDFVECIETGQTPTADGWSSGGRVVAWLEILSDVRSYGEDLATKKLTGEVDESKNPAG